MNANGRTDVDELARIGAALTVQIARATRGARDTVDRRALSKAEAAHALGVSLDHRALSEGTDSAGGFLTPEVRGATVIDRVRPKSVQSDSRGSSPGGRRLREPSPDPDPIRTAQSCPRGASRYAPPPG